VGVDSCSGLRLPRTGLDLDLDRDLLDEFGRRRSSSNAPSPICMHKYEYDVYKRVDISILFMGDAGDIEGYDRRT